MLSTEDFYEKAKNFALLKDCDGKFYTYEEYNTLIKDNQTNKDGQLVYLYASDKEAQYSYIEAAKNKGYNVLLMDGQLDTPLVGMLEQKLEKCTFTRVDSDTIERLIVKENDAPEAVDVRDRMTLNTVFSTMLPKVEKTEFNVDPQALGENAAPVMITQSEYMRRMKDMARIQPGMAFYGEMPDMYNIVLNTNHKLVKGILEDTQAQTEAEIKPIEAEIKGLEARKAVLKQQQDGKKPEELTQEEKDNLSQCEKDITAQQEKKKEILSTYAKSNKVIPQLIDLALLQNGMLKGEALNNFVKRSIELI